MRAGEFWVLYNYLRPNSVFNCNESITYTTHSTLPYLDNLEYIIGKKNRDYFLAGQTNYSRGRVATILYFPSAALFSIE